MPVPWPSPGLLAKFLLILTPVFLVLAVPGIGYMVHVGLRVDQEVLAARVGNQAARAAASLGRHDIRGNPRLAEDLLAPLAADRAFVCAELRDGGGLLVAMPPAQGCPGRQDAFELALPVGEEDGNVLRVRFSDVELRAAERLQLSLALSVVALAFLIAILAAAIGFRVIVGRPLRLLLASIHRSTETGERRPVGLHSRDELGSVIRAFDEMLQHESDRELALTRANALLQEAQQELVRRERLATFAEITDTVGHELRHPLGVIQNALFMIDSQAPDPNSTTRRATARAKRNIKRCERLIHDLQRYTRPRVPVPVSIDIDALIGRLVAQHEMPPGVAIRHVPGPLGVEVAADLDDTSYAIAQLIENACDATSDGGSAASDGAVTVKTRVIGESVSVSVCDTGSGIAADIMPRVFEPLFSTKGFGIGLGLPIVKKMAEQNDGEVTITSEPGRGAAVTLTLPLSRSRIIAAA